MNRKTIIIGAAAVLLFAILAGAGLFSQRQEDQMIQPSPTPTENDILPDPQEDWQSFNSEEHGFSIEHPSEVEAEDRPMDRVRLIQWGPTQREATEFYDGISVSFTSGSLEGQSLEEFVNNRQEESSEEPVTDRVSAVSPVTISNYSGYRFDVVSLGEFTYIYLPQGNNGYLEIINATADPTKQGFEQTVEGMLSTLQIED